VPVDVAVVSTVDGRRGVARTMPGKRRRAAIQEVSVRSSLLAAASLAIAATACSNASPPPPPQRAPRPPAPTATSGPAAGAAPAPAAADLAAAGTDFARDAGLLFRVAACGTEDPLPASIDARAVARHCATMKRRYAAYRRAWADRATAFIAALRPADLPRAVVYPFGGGDLTSALVAFPDAAEITTLSLEAAGDVRLIEAVPRGALEAELATVGHDIGRLFQAAHSTTKSLQNDAHSRLPGLLVFSMAALAAHGLEPVSLRYFDIEPDGSLRYLTTTDLERAAAAIEETTGPSIGRRRRWREQRSPFANVEIQLRRRGDPAAPVRTFRHVLANLDDAHLGPDRRVIAHLAAKGKVAVITKAASFLLWWDDFAIMRDYLTGHLAWMISDASGIPPAHAAKAGLEQLTYGSFTGPYFIQDPNNVRAAMVALWKRQPQRPLPFRFGYPDVAKNNHMMITRPAPGTGRSLR
jgi:hypothetical protein